MTSLSGIIPSTMVVEPTFVMGKYAPSPTITVQEPKYGALV